MTDPNLAHYPPPYGAPPPIPPKKRGKLLLGLAVASAAVVGACTVGIGVGLSQQQPTAPVAPVASTQAPPTSAPPKPSAPPATSAAPDPEEAADAAYAIWGNRMPDEASKMQEILGDIQTAAVAEDYEALIDSAGELVDQADAMKKVQPPSTGKYETLHDEYNAMLGDFRRAGVLMGQGVEELDVDKIDAASRKLESGSSHTEKVTEAIEDLG